MAKLIIFFGPSSSGKTAQAKKLKAHLGYEYISWSLLSKEIEKGIGQYKEHRELVKEINRKHLPFPKGFISAILKSELKPHLKKDNTKIIIDGFPKRIEEALELESLMEQMGLELDSVVRFNLDFETYLIRHRSSDNELRFSDNELQTHYDIYMSESLDAFHLLAPQAQLSFDLNASNDESQVFASLIQKLNTKDGYKYPLFEKAATTKLQTEFGEYDFTAYQNKVTYESHLVLSIGDIKDRRHVPVRVHSSCITGDIFHSYRCDCMSQLHTALHEVAKRKFGAVIYLFQEGRGINIINKIKAYHLQQNGRDTVDANTELGLPPEMRQYEVVKDILDDLGVITVDLMTNNPDKISKMQDKGVVIENRIPVIIKPNEHNEQYLATKRNKMHHMLG